MRSDHHARAMLPVPDRPVPGPTTYDAKVPEKHRTPWLLTDKAMPASDDDVWELYDGSADFSQAHDLAAERPEVLARLRRLWLIEATGCGTSRIRQGRRGIRLPVPAGHVA